MRKLYFFKTILLLCALVAGSGSVWATDVTFDFTSSESRETITWNGTGTQSSGGKVEGTKSGVTFSTNKGYLNTSNNLLQVYANANDFTITAGGGTITSITITCSANGNSSYGPQKFSGTGYTGGTGKTGTWIGSSTSVTLSNSAQVKVTKIDITYTPATIHVSSVSLNKTELILAVDEFENLTATITPNNATDKSVTWSTSNSAIADVDQTGKVNAIAAGGPVTITATSNDDNTKTATCTVNVIAERVSVLSVNLNKTSTEITIGGTETLTATVNPDNATNKNVAWSTSNAAVATVDNGVVSALSVGTANITVTTEDGSKTAICAVTVNPILVKNVSLNKNTTEITIGGTETLTATVNPDNATNNSITWSSSNNAVASVVDGVVTANAVGTATITITSNDGSGKTATCEVTVTANTTKPLLTETIFEETFANVTGTSNVVLENFDNAGWTSSGDVYGNSGDGVRLAKSAGPGSITTPVITNLVTGATLSFYAIGWDSDEITISLSGTDCSLSPTSFNNLSYSSFTEKEVTITVTGINPKITFSAASGKRVKIKDITITQTKTTIPVSLAASGYASYCSPFALDLTPTEDYAAYVVSSTSDATVTFTKIPGKVAAQTPFILYNKDKGGETVNLPIIEDDDEEIAAVGTNMLRGTLSPTYVSTVNGDYTNFGLSGGNFLKVSNGVVKANKAYLPILTANVPTTSDARMGIVFEDEASGISTLDNEAARNNIQDFFDLQGRRVAQPTKGLYILNGKKVLVK